LGWNQAIGIEDNKPIAFGPLKPEISCEPLSGVLLPEITYIQSVLKGEYDVPGIEIATIFNNDDLKIPK